jgi:hypothetical protein
MEVRGMRICEGEGKGWQWFAGRRIGSQCVWGVRGYVLG